MTYLDVAYKHVASSTSTGSVVALKFPEMTYLHGSFCHSVSPFSEKKCFH